MKQKLLLLVIMSVAFSLHLFGGTTGKLTGTITDADTGEPLPGINVILEGTTIGAATDLEGGFLINNIPPGIYSIKVSGVGFQTKRFVDVKIAVDFTTNLDVIMSTYSIEVEEVVVKAEAPLVREDLTSSHVSVDAAQIESLPVESVAQIISLQAGVTQGAGGELHIRGGRSNEIAYSVNGVSISNPNDNSKTVSIATNAIQELSVVSGTFNAEYGNALSGIVNTVTKEGGSNKYNGSVSLYTGDYLSTRDDIFDNIDEVDPFNNYVVEMTLSGPIPFTNNKLSVFASGRYNNDDGYLYGKREHTIYDYVTKYNDGSMDIKSSGDNKTVPMNSSESYSITSKLTYRLLSTLKLNYDFVLSHAQYQSYNHGLKFNPDANSTKYSDGMLHIFEIRHALSNSTFYTFRASYNIDDYKRYLFPLLDVNGNEADFYAGKSLVGLHADPRYQPEYKSNTLPAPISFSPGGTYAGGNQSHYYQRTYIYGGKFDMTSQLNKNHEVKFGAQVRSYEVNSHGFDILRDTTTYLKSTIATSNTTRNNFYSKKPIEISGYIQDKMEYDNIILNVGLRYDYFNANSKYAVNEDAQSLNDPEYLPTLDVNSLFKDAEAKHQISPRLGVSFPITDRGIIHFSYGHFYQLPPLSYLYTNSEFEYQVGTPTYGNANLDPERTIAYEIGLQQQLTDNLAINVTGYYKDVRDLLATQRIRIRGDKQYFRYVNKDYANIKGLVFSLTKRRTADDMLGLTLDYTYQVSEGNDVNPDAFFMDRASGRQPEKIPVFLSWDRTHQLNGTISVGEMGNWNVTLVGRISSGLPYTPEIFEKQINLEKNSDRKPSHARVDLMAEKTIEVAGLDLVLFVKVFNLFDTLNENLVYSNTGRSSYTLDELRGPAEKTDQLAKQYSAIKTSGEYYSRPDYYLPPREIRLGLSFEF